MDNEQLAQRLTDVIIGMLIANGITTVYSRNLDLLVKQECLQVLKEKDASTKIPSPA